MIGVRDALKKPVLVLAPHLQYPTRNGADILIDRRWRSYSRFVPRVDIVGKSTVSTYVGGELSNRDQFDNDHRSKPWAVVRTLVRRSHYLLEKFLTPAYRATARDLLSRDEYGLVVYSYLCTATLDSEFAAPAPAPERITAIETHNDDFKWFADIAASTRNPVAKRAARLSHDWTASFMKANAERYLFLHVTETDREGYERVVGEHPHIIAPIGVAIPNIETRPQTDRTLSLLFVGSLNTRINEDALMHFADTFWPTLREAFRDDLEFNVAGSNPTGSVRKLCRRMDWQLYENVSDEGLHSLYASTTSTVLPFSYATGAKLKLLQSLAHGVPFLGTSNLDVPKHLAGGPCLISDDPSAWCDRLRELHERPLPAAELQQGARLYSWDAIAEGVYQSLRT